MQRRRRFELAAIVGSSTILLALLTTGLLVAATGSGEDPATSQARSESYRQDLDRLAAVRQGKAGVPQEAQLSAYEQCGNEIQAKWLRNENETREELARLTLEICRPLSSGEFRDRRQYELARKYALSALAPVEMPVITELELAGHVMTDMHSAYAPSKEDFAQRRREDVVIRLHAWKRLLEAVDPKWNPQQVVVSPNAVAAQFGLPSGIGPESVKDPEVRAKYQAAVQANQKKIERYSEQQRLHDWLARYPPRAETYIIEAYSRPALALDELRSYLDKYLKDEVTKRRIIEAVQKNIGKDTTAAPK